MKPLKFFGAVDLNIKHCYSKRLGFLNGSPPFLEGIEPQNFRNLERHILGLRSGSTGDLESMLLQGLLPSEKQQKALQIVQIDRLANEYPWIEELERSEVQKIAPFSKIAPWSEVRSVYHDSFFEAHPNDIDRKSALIAIANVKKTLAPGCLRVRSTTKVLEATATNTQWGLPYYVSKPDEAQIQSYVSIAETDRLAGKVTRFPAVAGNRMQITPEKEVNKQRLVWIMPHSVVLNELTFALPLMEALRAKEPSFASFAGTDSTDAAISRIFDFARLNSSMLICMDFPAFDSTLGIDIIEITFDIIKHWFPDSEAALLDDLCDNLLTIPLLTPEGVWLDKKGGMPSGSGFTTVANTISHMWIREYVKVRSGLAKVKSQSVNCGDDGVWCIPGLEKLSIENAFTELGFEFRENKFLFSFDRATYLQRHYRDDYRTGGITRGVRIFTRAFATMCYLERSPNPKIWSKYFESVRWIAQLENLKYHPYYRHLVDEIRKIDRLQLGISVPGGVVNLFSLVGTEKEINAKLSTYMWLDSQAIKGKKYPSLETVKIIEELASNEYSTSNK
uniref:RdRp n=1 Tax=viral metagenome TaxID=1070528 RepID=A0A2V0RJH4_9ZZZZ